MRQISRAENSHAIRFMKYIYILVLTLSCFESEAQTNKDRLIGDWKFYLSDKTNFEFLRLNSDGTGIKCFGNTINGKDSLFVDHITTLIIKNWKVENKRLIIESTNNLSFDINPNYKLTFQDNDQIQLQGEHLIFNRFPSWLNRKDFDRTVTYQKANKISLGYGATVATCITREKIFSFTPVDSSTQIVEYKGFHDLIPHIISCSPGYDLFTKISTRAFCPYFQFHLLT